MGVTEVFVWRAASAPRSLRIGISGEWQRTEILSAVKHFCSGAQFSLFYQKCGCAKIIPCVVDRFCGGTDTMLVSSSVPLLKIRILFYLKCSWVTCCKQTSSSMVPRNKYSPGSTSSLEGWSSLSRRPLPIFEYIGIVCTQAMKIQSELTEGYTPGEFWVNIINLGESYMYNSNQGQSP